MWGTLVLHSGVILGTYTEDIHLISARKDSISGNIYQTTGFSIFLINMKLIFNSLLFDALALAQISGGMVDYPEAGASVSTGPDPAVSPLSLSFLGKSSTEKSYS